MSIKTLVKQSLDRLTTPISPPHDLNEVAGGDRFHASLVAVDQLAVAFSEFALTRSELASAGIDQLKRVAERLSSRLTYLLEPINPIEVDPQQCVVQMRSSPPQADDDGTQYYELLVRQGGDLRLVRYCKRRGEPRQIVPAHVTREVFVRLVGDFAEVDPN